MGVEACDDGNTSNADACTNTCKLASCGDGVVQGNEECDDGNMSDTDACLSTCLQATCGDGFVQAGVEVCDDGNDDNTDACPNTCETARCGDGFVQTGVEQCDDANTSNTDDCLNTCVNASCGDGFAWLGVEGCDDGNMTNNDTCTNLCTLPGCGDGILQVGEECDDNNLINTDGCLDTCTIATCGDGFVRAGVEQCDDANTSNTDACTNTCKNAFCGDGFVRATVEECDDMNTTSNDGCSSTCTVEGCVTASAIPCNGARAARNDGAGSFDLVDKWACSTFSYTGPEIAYSFTPTSSGLVQIKLSGLAADLDLIVMKDTGMQCSPTDLGMCVGKSTRAGSADETVEFTAVANTKYYLVIDGFNNAVSAFNLTAGSISKYVQINEVGGYAATDDFVELINRSACPAPLSGLVVEHLGTCDASVVQTASFATAAALQPGQVARATEGTRRAGIDVPYTSCDLIYDGPTHTMLCSGSCDRTSCSNVLDYMTSDNNSGSPTGGPTCATFSPNPVNVLNMVTGQSINRTAFTGAPTTWRTTDWILAPETGN